MPLPDEFFQGPSLLNKDKKKVRSTISSNLPMPGEVEEETSETGSLWDLLEQGAKGYASGLSWGATELLEDRDEELSRYGQAGRILGETGALFTPFVGPFALLGKGGNLLTKFGKHSTPSLIKKGASSVASAATKGRQAGDALIEQNYVLKQAQRISKASQGTSNPMSIKQVTSQISDNIEKGLMKSSYDEKTYQWMQNLAGNADQRQMAMRKITQRTSDAIKAAFAKSGVKGVSTTNINNLTNRFVEEVSSGKHINEITAMWSKWLGAGPEAGAVKDFLANYGGQAMQDILIMGMHGSVSQYMKTVARGEQYTWDHAYHDAKMNATMGLIFPAIRLVPFGGKESLTQGYKNFMSSYQKMDYKQMIKENGEESMTGLVKMIQKGGLFDMKGLSVFRNKGYTVNGVTYKNADSIQRAIARKDFNADDVVDLLEQYRSDTVKHLTKDWAKKYFTDFAWSSPRMAFGTMAMNTDLFKEGAFDGMNPEEIGIHMLTAALMTKSRGHWGHDKRYSDKTQTEHLADMTPYREAMDLLGLDPKGYTETIRMYDEAAVVEKMGSVYGNHTAGQEIFNAFESAGRESGGRTAGKYNAMQYPHVSQLNDVYRMIYAQKGGNDVSSRKSSFDPKYFTAETLNSLETRLKKIKFNDGESFENLSFESIKGKLTREAADGTWDVFKGILLEFNDIGINVREVGDKRLQVDNFEWGNKDGDAYSQAYDVFKKFEDLGLVEFTQDTRQINTADANMLEKAQEIIHRGKITLNRHHGIEDWNFDFSGGKAMGGANPYIDFVADAKSIEALEGLSQMVERRAPKETDPQSFKELERLGLNADLIFRVKTPVNGIDRNRYLNHINDYDIVFTDKEIESFSKGKNQEAALGNRRDDIRAQLDGLFEIMGFTDGTRHSGNVKGQIEYSKARKLADQFVNLKMQLPSDVRNRFGTQGVDYIKSRYLSSRKYDQRAINTVLELVNYWDIKPSGEGKLQLPGIKWFRQSIRDQHDNISKAKLEDAVDKYERVVRSIGTEHIDFVDMMFADLGQSRRLQNIDVLDIHKIHAALKDKEFNTFISSGADIVAEVMGKGTVNELELNALHQRFENIRNNVDNISKKPLEDMAVLKEEIENIRLKDIEALSKPVGEKSNPVDGKPELSAKESQRLSDRVQQWDTVLQSMELFNEGFNKVNMKYKDSPELQGALEAWKNGEGTGITGNIGNVIASILTSKQKSVGLLQKMIIEMSTRTAVGREGYSRSESMHYFNKIEKQIAKELGQLYNKDLSFKDLIKLYNEHGGVDRLRSIYEAYETMKNINVSKHSKYTQEFSDILQSLDAKSPISSSSNSPMVIAKRYGLESRKDPNDFDPVFVDKVAQDDLLDAFDYGISNIDAMAAADKSMTKSAVIQKKREWAKDAPGLMLRLTNSREAIEMRLVEGGLIHETMSVRDNPNRDFKNRPWAPGESGYDMLTLNQNMVVTANDGKTLRKINLNDLVGQDGVTPTTVHAYLQNLISKQKLVDGDMRKYIMEKMGDDKTVLQKDIKTFADAAQFADDYLIYMRITPGMHDLFVASQDNVRKLNNDYDGWYTQKVAELSKNSPELVETFKNSFGDVSKMVGSTDKPTNKNLELKMLLMHTDYAMSSEFNKVLKMIKSGDTLDLPKVYANMFKRGFLVDGGTSNRMNEKMLNLVNKVSTLSSVSKMSSQLLADSRIGTLIIKDEALHKSNSGGGTADPFHVRHVVERQIQRRFDDRVKKLGKNMPKQEFEIYKKHLERIKSEEISSLESSNINGAIPISYKLMNLFLAAEGKTIKDGNGIKPIIAQAGFGSDGALGKGFLYYDPTIKFPTGVDMMLPESSAKAYGGKSLNGAHDITGLDLIDLASNVDGNWTKQMNTRLNAMGNFDPHIMGIDYKNVGLGFTGHDPGKVNISNSLNSLENSAYVAEMRTWQKMENIIDNLHVSHIEKLNTKNKLSEWLFQMKEDQGFEYSQGSTGLARALVSSSINISNPLIRNTVFRLIRSQDFKSVQKPFSTNGADAFIVPDSQGMLRHSMQIEIAKEVSIKEKLDLINQKALPKDWSDGLKNRVTVQYGEIAVPEKVLSRIYHNNLDKYTFAYNDNGIDVLASGTGGINTFKSEYYSVHDNYTGAAIRNTTGTTKANLRIAKRDKAKEAQVDILMKGLNQAVVEQALTLKDINEIITYNETAQDFVASKGNRLVYLTDYVKLTRQQIQDLDFSLTGSGVAIPLKGGDKGIHRLSKSMLTSNMDGLVKINSYDAAVVHQRDYDGDHFYYYFDKPWKSVKGDVNTSMRMLDYKQFEKPNPDINPFGFSKDFKAGQEEASIGHQKFATMVNQAKRAIGTNIGDRDAISQLIRLGFKHKQQGGMQDIVGEFNNNINDMSSSEWGIFERMMYINQSGFDVYPSVPKILDQANLRRLSLKGDKRSESLDDPLFDNLSDANIFNDTNWPGIRGKSPHWSETRLGDHMINILMRTLKNNNMISNNVYDESGGRPPEPIEIRNQMRDMQSFISNPNRYIVDKLQNTIKRMSNKQEREALLEEMMNTFYSSDYNNKITYKDRIGEWINDFYEGKTLPAPDEVFQFRDRINKSTGQNRILQAIRAHTGFHNLYEVNKRHFYTDDQFADVNNEFFPGLMNSVGFSVDGLLGRIKFIQAYGGDVYSKKDGKFKFKIDDPQLDFTDFKGNRMSVNRAIQRGLVLSALKSDYKDLSKQLKYISEERFTNPMKITSIRDKMDNLNTGIKLLERKYYDGLVAEDKGNVIRRPRTYQEGQSWIRRKPVDRTYVYAIKKDYLDNNNKPDYTKFDPMQSGWYGPKEYGRKQYVQKPDFMYIETKQPAVWESVNKVDAAYADALQRITLHVGDADAVFKNEYMPTMEYYDSVIELRARLSENARDHNRLRKKTGRVMQPEAYEWTAANEDMMIREFIDGGRGREGWVDILQNQYNLSEYDARRFLLYNLSKPEAIGGHFSEVSVDGQRLDIPYYKMNNRLTKGIVKYYVDHGDNFARSANGKKLVDEFVNNWENTVEGNDLNVRSFVANRNSMYHKKYNLNRLSKADSYIESLLGPAFGRNPFVEYKLEQAQAEYVKQSTIESNSNTQKIIVKKPNNGQRRSSNDC